MGKAKHDRDAIYAALDETGSVRAAAAKLQISEATVRYHYTRRQRTGGLEVEQINRRKPRPADEETGYGQQMKTFQRAVRTMEDIRLVALCVCQGQDIPGHAEKHCRVMRTIAKRELRRRYEEQR